MSAKISYQIEPEGDSAIIIRLQSTTQQPPPNIEVNFAAIQIAQKINASLQQYPFLIEAIPTFSTVGVYYRLGLLAEDTFNQVCLALKNLCDAILPQLDQQSQHARTVEIPVCYDPEFGIDLVELSQTIGISIDDIIALHSQHPVRVFMLGFSPGLPYLGLFDEKFNIPRHSTPRVKLAAGSIAIANRQGVIYPYETPGGWHIVGRTPIRLFNPDKAPYTLYQPGDNIIFKPISKAEFMRLQQDEY